MISEVNDELKQKITYLISKLENLRDKKKKEKIANTQPAEMQIISNSKECENVLCEIATVLGYHCLTQYKLGGLNFIADVVWKTEPLEEAPPLFVFEISHGGDLWKDINSLRAAKAVFHAIPVLVVHPSKLDEAERYLKKTLTYDKILLMSFEHIEDIYKLFKNLHEKLGEFGLGKLLSHDAEGLRIELYKKLRESA